VNAGPWFGRPLVAGMVLGVILVAGLVSVPRVAVLPGSERPASWIDVSLAAEGYTADAVDRQVAGRVEELVRTVRGVRSLRTVSERERLFVRADCSGAEDLARVRAAIAGRLFQYCERAGTGLSVDRIGVSGGSFGQGDFLRIGVWGRDERTPPADDVRRTIVPALLAVPGVAGVGLEGEDRRGVVLTPQKEAVIRHHLSSSGVADVVLGHPCDSRIGTLPVASPVNGRPLRLAACAGIRERMFLPEVVWRIDGNAAIVVSVRRRPEADPLRLAHGVSEVFRACGPAIASRIQWAVLEDPSERDREGVGAAAWLAAVSAALMALAAGWCSRTWRASMLTIGMIACLISGLLVALVLAGKALDPATVSGAVLGFAFQVPGICRLVLPRASGGGPTGLRGSLAGAVAGLALFVLSRFSAQAEASRMLADAGFGLVAVSGSGFLARPVETFRTVAIYRPRTPSALIRALVAASWWCRRQRRVVMGLQVLILGIPLWLVPQELPRSNPFFRLHLVSFGSSFYREYRPLIERLLGGIVTMAVTNGLRGDEGEDRRGVVVEATVDLPAGSRQHAAAVAASPLEARARALVQGMARVVTRVAAERASVRVEFVKAPTDGSLPLRVNDALRGVAAGLGNVRVVVLGTGPGFQSGQTALPALTVELRGYDRQIMELAAEGFRRYLESDQRVHDVDLLASGGVAEREHELHLIVDPRTPGGRSVAPVAQAFLGHAAVSRAWGTDLDGRPVLVKVEGSIGDTLELEGRGPGGAAMALKDVVELREVEVSSAIVREQREYVRRISCVVDAPAEIAREILAGYCGSFPIPPGCRLVIGAESAQGPSSLMSALGWGAALAAAAAGIAVAAVRNSVRAALVLAASLPAAGIGACLALVLVPLPGGAWELCACGAVMIACGAAGLTLFAGRVAGDMYALPLRGTLTFRLEELFGCWLLLIGALAPFALVPMAVDVPVAFHASTFALVCCVGGTVGLLLVPLTLPAWVLARS
jgi:multidrug efflux pump subunit AcrB